MLTIILSSTSHPRVLGKSPLMVDFKVINLEDAHPHPKVVGKRPLMVDFQVIIPEDAHPYPKFLEKDHPWLTSRL